MSTHDIELPQGYTERPFDYSGDLYIEGQVREIIEINVAPLQAEIERLRAEREMLWVELENWKECFCQAASGAKRLEKTLGAYQAAVNKIDDLIEYSLPMPPETKAALYAVLTDLTATLAQGTAMTDRYEKTLGVLPECDAQQPADDEVVFIDGVGAGRSSIKSCHNGVQWIRVGDRVYWPLSDSDAKRLQSACCGNGSFDGPATPAVKGEQQ